MPKFIADLEIHSKYARAVSQQMTPENLAFWAVKKGIKVLGTGDFTHPLWLKDLKEKLEPAETGLFQLKKNFWLEKNSKIAEVRFLLSGEISCVYTKNGKGRRVHHLVYAPNFETADKICSQLSWVGNIHSDGRPIINIDSKELLKMILDASPDCALIPAHVWTPWFGVFGSKSGFNSLEECFDELTPQIFAIETGLSSDPPMNWRIPFLDDKAIISGSDSHSLSRLGREAIILNTDLSYQAIMKAIKNWRDPAFEATIEFFPEEGKYHYDGHFACRTGGISPEQTKALKGLCPVCGRPVTVGVMARIQELAPPNRPAGFKPDWAKPYYSLVPFDQIIADALNVGLNSKAVWREYETAIANLDSEFNILLNVPEKELRVNLPPLIAEGVYRIRQGKVKIEPGYDGQYGRIKIFEEEERKDFPNQSALF